MAYSGLPKDAWMLSLVVFINRSGSMVLFFMTLYLTEKLDFTIAQAGRMLSVYGAGSLVGSYLGGMLSDTVGARRVQIMSLISNAAVLIILNFLEGPLWIAVTLFLLALVTDAFRPANASVLAEVCPAPVRARGFVLNRLAINLGVTIGPALGGFLATWNYHYLFWVDSITCLLAAVILWLFFPGRKPIIHQDADAHAQPNLAPWKDKIFLRILLTIFLGAMVFFQLFNTWPIYLKDVYSLMENDIGLLLAINGIIIVLIEMPLIHRLEKLPSLRVVAAGTLFMCGGFALLPLGNSFSFGAFTVIIWTIGEMLVFPLISGFVANRAGDKTRGKYMGMFNFSFSLAIVLSPALGTWVYEALGPTTLWLAAGGMGLIIFSGYVRIDNLLGREVKAS